MVLQSLSQHHCSCLYIEVPSIDQGSVVARITKTDKNSRELQPCVSSLPFNDPDNPSSVEFSAHRIIEWFGMEGTLKIVSFQPPCLGHFSPDQVAQSFILPGLQHSQGWGNSQLFWTACASPRSQ